MNHWLRLSLNGCCIGVFLTVAIIAVNLLFVYLVPFELPLADGMGELEIALYFFGLAIMDFRFLLQNEWTLVLLIHMIVASGALFGCSFLIVEGLRQLVFKPRNWMDSGFFNSTGKTAIKYLCGVSCFGFFIGISIAALLLVIVVVFQFDGKSWAATSSFLWPSTLLLLGVGRSGPDLYEVVIIFLLNAIRYALLFCLLGLASRYLGLARVWPNALTGKSPA